MSGDRKKNGSFEDAAHTLYGCLAQVILIFVLIANLLAYIFSAKYRAMLPFDKFIVYMLVWIVLTVGFWWMQRSAAR